MNGTKKTLAKLIRPVNLLCPAVSSLLIAFPLSADDLEAAAGCIKPTQTAIEYLTAFFNKDPRDTSFYETHCQLKVAKHVYGIYDSSYSSTKESDETYRSAYGQNHRQISTAQGFFNAPLYQHERIQASNTLDDQEENVEISTLRKPGYETLILRPTQSPK